MKLRFIINHEQMKEKKATQCEACGGDLETVTAVNDFFDPAHPYGHGQREEEVSVCPNESCENF